MAEKQTKKIDKIKVIEKRCETIILNARMLIQMNPSDHRFNKGQIDVAECILDEIKSLNTVAKEKKE